MVIAVHEAKLRRSTATTAVSAFISYAHQDEKWKNRLIAHLTTLQFEGLLGVWHDRKLTPGQHLDRSIEKELAAARLIILLLSPDFIASRYCAEIEMMRAFERAKRGRATVVSLILRPCEWRLIPLIDDLVLGDFVALPKDGKPIVSWRDPDEAFVSAVIELRQLIQKM